MLPERSPTPSAVPCTRVAPAWMELSTSSEIALARELGVIERQVESTYDDARYVMRVLPYRTVDDVDPDVVRRVREMSRATALKHTVGETDWHVPVTDTWARAAGITAIVCANARRHCLGASR